MSRALFAMRVLVHHTCSPFPGIRVTWLIEYTFNHLFIFTTKFPPNSCKSMFFIWTSTFRQVKNYKLVKTHVGIINNLPFARLLFLQLHELTPSALPQQMVIITCKTIKGENVDLYMSHILPAITVCCKMTVTPEGAQVMSRGDTEVGQLLGVCYIMHIHKQHPVVAEWSRSAQTVHSVHWAPRSLFTCSIVITLW